MGRCWGTGLADSPCLDVLVTCSVVNDGPNVFRHRRYVIRPVVRYCALKLVQCAADFVHPPGIRTPWALAVGYLAGVGRYVLDHAAPQGRRLHVVLDLRLEQLSPGDVGVTVGTLTQEPDQDVDVGGLPEPSSPRK